MISQIDLVKYHLEMGAPAQRIFDALKMQNNFNLYRFSYILNYIPLMNSNLNITNYFAYSRHILYGGAQAPPILFIRQHNLKYFTLSVKR